MLSVDIVSGCTTTLSLLYLHAILRVNNAYFWKMFREILIDVALTVGLVHCVIWNTERSVWCTRPSVIFYQLRQSIVVVLSERERPLYVIARASLCLSVICRLSVCNVHAPCSGDWNSRQCFYAVGWL